mgnify:CR=1 FL=1
MFKFSQLSSKRKASICYTSTQSAKIHPQMTNSYSEHAFASFGKKDNESYEHSIYNTPSENLSLWEKFGCCFTK